MKILNEEINKDIFYYKNYSINNIYYFIIYIKL